MTPVEALVVASSAHAGFQVTVTVLVYPQLARVEESAWTATHARHSRLIVPLVGLLYAGLLGTGAWVLATGPHPLALASLVCAAGCLAVTALGAAPLHGRLDAPHPGLLRRLLVVDRVRAGLAVAAAALAALAVA